MRPLSAAALLEVWEQGQRQTPARRAVVLLAAAEGEPSPEALATLTIGTRDWRLLRLREWMFGSQLACVANCASCNEQLEWTLKIGNLLVSDEREQAEGLLLETNGYRVHFRLPNSLDLASIADCKDIAKARRVILERCLSLAEFDNQTILPGDLPAEVAEMVVNRMAEADPQGNIKLDLTCPACGHRWQALFNIESFFWGEINVWAQRTLKEVHTLARAYSWSERDILNLSPCRRQFYLNLIGSA